jgi:acetyl-CoA carboxylase carboxyl transferase subunit beta
VIEQTIGETPPDDYRNADFLLEHGMVDQVVTRREVPTVLGSVLRTRMMGRDRLPAA